MRTLEYLRLIHKLTLKQIDGDGWSNEFFTNQANNIMKEIKAKEKANKKSKKKISKKKPVKKTRKK